MSLVPDLLTIEEAARVLRIGRTKAYAMGQEWRVTDGRSGIKVREFGGQLRVPRVWIEEQLGAPLQSIPQRPHAKNPKPQDVESAAATDTTSEPTQAAEPGPSVLQLLPPQRPEPATNALPTVAKSRRAKRHNKRRVNPDQLTLPFD